MAVRVSSFVLMGLLLAGLVGCHRAQLGPTKSRHLSKTIRPRGA